MDNPLLNNVIKEKTFGAFHFTRLKARKSDLSSPIQKGKRDRKLVSEYRIGSKLKTNTFVAFFITFTIILALSILTYDDLNFEMETSYPNEDALNSVVR